MLDQDNNFFLISLSILITCWPDNVGILWEEVTSKFKSKGTSHKLSRGEGVEGFLGGPHGLRGGTKGRSIVANRV